MKIMWLVNQPLPSISARENMQIRVTEGWLVGLSAVLVKKEVKLIICFPQNQKKELMTGMVDGYCYYGFFKKNIYKTKLNDKVKKCLEQVIEREKPDIIHFMGTEFLHASEMYEASVSVGYQDRVLVSIQGLTSRYSEVYMGGLPEAVYSKRTLRDMLLRDGLQEQQKKMRQRGDHETELLSQVTHVIGRTEWDYQEVKKICPQVQYYKNNENLRPEFYEGCWDYDQCEPHRIFAGQVTYPLKGVHFLLEGFAVMLREYPDARLYVAGKAITAKPRWRWDYYKCYLMNLIKKYALEDKVFFLGELSAEEMKRQYLKANVFVLPSVIENSSNALGEAMILGTPVVASCVGGTPSMLEQDADGFLYPFDQVEKMVDKIKKLFDNPDLARQVSAHARTHASQTHDREKNCEILLQIYWQIMEENRRRQ